MKKIIVIILLILPFVLIYSISFTGKILSEYTHIYAERIVIENAFGDEYKENSIIKIGKGELFDLNVKVYPELASNKEFTISNSNREVCEVVEGEGKIKGLDYGVSQITLTSKDTFVTFAFSINVSDDHIQSIIASESEIELGVGMTKEVEIKIFPITTLPEYRGVSWSSADDKIAKVNENGVITGVSEGQTVITVQSNYKKEVYAQITVTVSSEQVIEFTFTGDSFVTTLDTVNLKDLIMINLQDYSNLKFTVTAGLANADVSNLLQGIIKFNKYGVYKIEVSLLHGQTEYRAKITVIYKNN